jgi:cytochrome c oxidase cbb3-type subunit III
MRKGVRAAAWSTTVVFLLVTIVQGGGQRGGRGGGDGQGRGGFPQFTRELAPQDVLVRGKSLYEAQCASCHAVDLRGGPNGTNLMRSGTALRDKGGELIGPAVAKHTPALTPVQSDVVAIAEYIHSINATAGRQGSPPGRNPTGLQLNVLIGDVTEGEAAFKNICSKCHSVTDGLKGIGSKYPDPRALQNAWVSGQGGFGGGGERGGGGGGGGRGRGGGGPGRTAVVTMADGSKLEGALLRKDDFIVILTMPDGARKSIARDPNTGIPRVDVRDPNAAHKEMVLKLDDRDNKRMHDITAYLWTIK